MFTPSTRHGRVLPCMLIAVVAIVAAHCGRSPVPSGEGWRFRVPISVHAAGFVRHYRAVEIPLDEARWFGDEPFVPTAFRLVEVDATGRAVRDRVPFQIEPAVDVPTRRVLVLLLAGTLAADDTRRFHLYMGSGPEELSHPDDDVNVRLTDNAPWYEQLSAQITTPWATWVYHKEGAGFASLIDRDGHDWISYRPEGGAAGSDRGLPNLVHPERHLHPGSRSATTTVLSTGPIRVQLVSETRDGAWACTWSVYATHATMTLHRAAGPYWFVYAGTPGGVLDQARDMVVRSTGERTRAADHWNMRLPVPRWVYVSAGNAPRSLFVAHHEDDGDGDQYWPADGHMTVLGFGREYPCCGRSLTAVPARFTVGLTDSRDAATVPTTIDGAFRDLDVVVGNVEPRDVW